MNALWHSKKSSLLKLLPSEVWWGHKMWEIVCTHFYIRTFFWNMPMNNHRTGKFDIYMETFRHTVDKNLFKSLPPVRLGGAHEGGLFLHVFMWKIYFKNLLTNAPDKRKFRRKFYDIAKIQVCEINGPQRFGDAMIREAVVHVFTCTCICIGTRLVSPIRNYCKNMSIVGCLFICS
jgi:hypothetical protein